MSKPRHGSKHHSRRSEPLHEEAEPRRQIPRGLLVCIAAIVLAGIPFALGKYFEFCTPDAFDGGSYAYSAKHILDGAEIGVDEMPSAQLGTLLVNMLGVMMTGFNEKGAEIIQMICQAMALVLMFVTMRKLFGSLAAIVAVVVASVYLSAPVIAKFGNVKEQYMIAFMTMGICFFVLSQLKNCKYAAMLAGACLIWAPLFKPTGLSAVGAVGLFVVLQPVFKHGTWRQMGRDILWLFVGAIVAIAPAYIWMIGWNIQMALPYQVIWDTLAKHLSSPAADQAQDADYISASRKAISFSVLSSRVLRYYGVLILPVALATLSCVMRIARLAWTRLAKRTLEIRTCERFVLLFGVWWLLDMIFVWVSPRSYEQYYLPLNASAAMLAGYPVALYASRFAKAENKPKWAAIGLLSLLVMIVLSLHIFIGISKSPHSGTQYRDPDTREPIRTRGYVQKWREVRARRKNPDYKGGWERVGDYIRQNSSESDGIYVWGWFPGIYVTAQRLSPAPKAFEGTMHTLTPPQLSERVAEVLDGFAKQPPKFIVDTYKSHFPWDRPPLELWFSIRNAYQLLQYAGGLPSDRTQHQQVLLQTFRIQPADLEQTGFVRADNAAAVARFDAIYKAKLATKWPDEAQRYESMRPLREYVMNNYRIVNVFGQHVLFQHK